MSVIRSADVRNIKYDHNGLVPVIAQDAHTGEVRMMAYANAAALARTLESGQACFYSRSRERLWVKGEESGNVLTIQGVFADCDRDCVLYLVRPVGPTCHTGAQSCFADAQAEPAPTLLTLERELKNRTTADADKSYTKKLLDAGCAKIAAKLNEEAGELGDALENESDLRVVSEAADVMYHLVVGLVARGIAFADVARELERRFGTSGLDEKASRGVAG